MMDSVNQAVKQTGLQNIQLGSTLTQEELQRVITAATVSALRHQEAQGHPRQRSASAVTEGDHFAAHGHAAPAWSRTVSASVLLACTALFATIAGASVSRAYESSTYGAFSRVAHSCGGLHLEGFRHRREVPWRYSIRSGPKYYRVHECNILCIEWEYRA